MLLAIDPGTQKCGLAITNGQAEVLTKLIVPAEKLKEVAGSLIRKFPINTITIGDQTNSKVMREMLKSFNLPIIMVDEGGSSVEGKYRYLKENTKGLARLIPIGLRIPQKPYDDYVAVILAERFIRKHIPG